MYMRPGSAGATTDGVVAGVAVDGSAACFFKRIQDQGAVGSFQETIETERLQQVIAHFQVKAFKRMFFISRSNDAPGDGVAGYAENRGRSTWASGYRGRSGLPYGY